MSSLKGKIVLVTGASAGIGFATAHALALQGMEVIGCARNVQTLLELNGSLKDNPILTFSCDLTQETEVLQLFRMLEEKYGRMDVLINNAGMGGSGTNILNGEYRSWKTMLDLNVLGLTLVTKEAVKLMEAGQRGGHVINLNSIAGHRVPQNPSRQFYSATKHMLRALTEALRENLASKNIRVTSLSPGLVETEFAERAYGTENHDAASIMYGQYKVLEPKDIAETIIFILSLPTYANVNELVITPLLQQKFF